MKLTLLARAILTLCRGALGLLILTASGMAHSYQEEDVELKTSSGTIRGTLTLPTSVGRAPVVLLIAGSGPTDRDGNSGSARPASLKLLARALSDSGIAVLSYDKRGVAASANAAHSEADLRFGDYVDDAAAWVTQLQHDARFSRVAVVGHSEGALIGAMASVLTHPFAFVSVAGISESANKVLRHQLMGALPPELAASSDQIISALEHGKSVADVPAPLMTLYRPSVQPYLISWFKVDPQSVYSKLTDFPTLIVQGDTDQQVSLSQAEALHAVTPGSKLMIVHGMNHMLKTASADNAAQLATFTDSSIPLSADFAPAVIAFLKDQRDATARRTTQSVKR